VRLLLTLCAAVVAGWAINLVAKASPVQVQPQDEDTYAIYAAAIPMDTWFWENSQTLLIRQQTTTVKRSSTLPLPRKCFTGDADFSRTYAEVLDAFADANKTERSIERRLLLEKPYRLISQRELDTIFHERPDASGGFDTLREHYPESAGYLLVSSVAFSKNRQLALVSIEHHCGNSCGAASYYFLAKSDNTWTVINPSGLQSSCTVDS
jgi:hypothetical protein